MLLEHNKPGNVQSKPLVKDQKETQDEIIKKRKSTFRGTHASPRYASRTLGSCLRLLAEAALTILPVSKT